MGVLNLNIARGTVTVSILLGMLWPLKLWAVAEAVVHHDLDILISPQSHLLEVTDVISLPVSQADVDEVVFFLHGDLEVELERANGAILYEASEVMGGAVLPVHVKTYVVKPAYKQTSFTLHYSGKIHHPLRSRGEEYARSFRDTPGNIAEEGVFLAATSAWYPLVEGANVSFAMQVTMPSDWKVVSQGQRLRSQEVGESTQVVWQEKNPQEEIYLIAARFHEYSELAGSVEGMAFLRQDDAALASQYLAATKQYIDMYSQLIGPYPYAKFALVENFWETGYGMPSFTLLGPKVIRLPFILHSSYPHEILHNWWGNAVYVDYQQGNWAEGLTSYLADHLIKEMSNDVIPFRRSILQNYADFVSESKDMKLADFRSRHSSSSEAIGYGKSQMFYHMLRLTIGDNAFVRGLQRFYQQNKFKQASFDDLKTAFEYESKQKLAYFFEQWLQRIGAPELEITNVKAAENEGIWQLHGQLRQMQDGEAYRLSVPLIVTLLDRSEAYYHRVELTAGQGDFSFSLPARPLRVDVDPEFDIFRRVSRAEIPAALSQAFGAERALLVLPSRSSKSLLAAYEGLASAWSKTQPTAIEVVYDHELEVLPEDKAVWLLGAKNRFSRQVLDLLTKQDVVQQEDGLVVGERKFDLSSQSVVLATRLKPHSKHAVVWLAADHVEAIPGLARKLPHYRKYGLLAFTGEEPVNELKEQWIVATSPMTVFLEEQDAKVSMANLKRRAALVE